MENRYSNTENRQAVALAEGDEQVFAEIDHSYRLRLVYYATKLSLSRTEAEDVVAESFLKLWKGRSGFSSDAHIVNFLFTATRNAALNLLDYKKRQKGYLTKYQYLEEARQETFSHERVETEVLQLIYEGMKNLPPECNKVFQLYLSDHSTAEIAEKLTISTGTVRSQKRRAVTLLREWLGDRKLLLITAVMTLLLKGIIS